MTSADFPLYRYRGKLARIIDGDTCELDVDLGFGVTFRARIRLMGYNAPEMHGPNPEQAAKAREYLALLLKDGWIYLATKKDSQSFSRYLATVYIEGLQGVMADVADLMKGSDFDVPQGG